VSGDFDPESRVLLARVQASIATVTGSAVAAAGLLDDAANDVILSRQEWEIACALARRAPGPGGPGPGRGGWNARLAIRRVEALEWYAGHVRDADAALSQRLAEPGVAPAAESVALTEIEDLAEYARRVGDAIRAAPGGTGPTGSRAPDPQPGNG
jgi:hypothetical protein